MDTIVKNAILRNLRNTTRWKWFLMVGVWCNLYSAADYAWAGDMLLVGIHGTFFAICAFALKREQYRQRVWKTALAILEKEFNNGNQESE